MTVLAAMAIVEAAIQGRDTPSLTPEELAAIRARREQDKKWDEEEKIRRKQADDILAAPYREARRVRNLKRMGYA
jgi:hypothetical protein